MNFKFLTFACFIALVCEAATTKKAAATTKAATTKAATTKAPVTKKDGGLRKVRPTRKKYDNVHLINDQGECINKNGKWIEMTLTDEGGTNGIQMDFVKVVDQKAVKIIKTPVNPQATDRRLSRRGDVITFKESFCLDYLGKDFSPCYDIVTSSQGKNLEEVSWSVKVVALKRASEAEKAKGGKDTVMEAIKEGVAYDNVKILCGRLYKQLGRFTDRQVAKLNEDLALDKNDIYRKTKAMDRALRTAAKIAQKTEDLNLVSASE